MKFQEGKFVAKMRKDSFNELSFFMKVWYQNGDWFLKIDDGAPQRITEDIRDHLIQDIDLESELRADYRPSFKKVKVTIEATSDKDSEHIWTRTNGEALEKLLKVFPGLIDGFWVDGNRKKKIHNYIRLKHHKHK